ncbi:MAG: bifunctional riboflavin kinase/FAD synthetase [Ectothiorhodospiraceae bacterium]|nr:bifunctional riboflavin kinase/FAD synthetase [Ectothiorhodospiraceae bacterium]MCH8505265.1 bifunctional riboflavin kinase/FAD synthetase [Ectothiorhodospiraceae bacterium]
MELIRGLHNLRRRHTGCVATIGNFDGVHLGHQAILQRLRARASALSLPSVVISFEPLPRELFAPGQAPARLSTLRDKAAKLDEAGIDRFLCLRFDRRLAGMEPDDFIRELLLDGLGVQYLLVGDDFRFGHQRRGDHAMLQQAAREHGFELDDTPTVALDGKRVSSTWVREALASGELGLAERLLGRPYCMSGRVINGDRIGRELGFPTANLAIRRRPPMDGVAVVEVSIEAGPWLPAVGSVGTRPTVNGRRPVCEVHLLDWSGNLYGKHLRVRFRHWLRGQAHYPDLDQLRRQIAQDAEAARDWLRGRSV